MSKGHSRIVMLLGWSVEKEWLQLVNHCFCGNANGVRLCCYVAIAYLLRMLGMCKGVWLLKLFGPMKGLKCEWQCEGYFFNWSVWWWKLLGRSSWWGAFEFVFMGHWKRVWAVLMVCEWNLCAECPLPSRIGTGCLLFWQWAPHPVGHELLWWPKTLMLQPGRFCQ